MAESEIFIPGPLNEKERAELLKVADELRSRKAWIDLLMFARVFAAPKRKRKPGRHPTLAQTIRDERLVAHYLGVLDGLKRTKRLAPKVRVSRRVPLIPLEPYAPPADQAAAIATGKTLDEGRLAIAAARARRKRTTI